MAKHLQTSGINVIPLSDAIYFVEVETPYRWSGGPVTYLGNPHGDMSEYPFSSLEAARQFAEDMYVPGHSERSTKVTYGVRYEQVLSGSPLPASSPALEER